jgi:outer membrane receptor protein involved in Fe transport
VLTNSPAHLVQALFSAPVVAKTVVGLDMRAMSSRLTAMGQPVNAHVVPNVTLSGPILGGALRYSFSVSNLTNQQYADPLSTDFVQTAMPQNGRAARLRLFWSF